MTNEELVTKIQAGERERIPELWKQVERFVRWRAGRVSAVAELGGSGGADADDLYQSGFLAFLPAVNSFDAGKGMSFVGWFNLYLRTAFAETMGLRTPRQRQDPIQHAVSMSDPLTDDDLRTVGDTIVDTAAEAAFTDLEEQDRKKQLYAALETVLTSLPDAEQSILRARYYQGHTLEQISAERGIGRERVRQIEAKAIA